MRYVRAAFFCCGAAKSKRPAWAVCCTGVSSALFGGPAALRFKPSG